MRRLHFQRRTLALLAFLVPLAGLFIYVALRSGPLAPVPVTVATVEPAAIRPALFGVGAVEARYSYAIGPTAAGRLKTLDVHVGDRVRAGQILGEIDPVDLDERIRAQDAAHARAQAAIREAEARQVHAATENQRYQKLLAVGVASQQAAAAKRQESQIADAALAAARQEALRVRTEREAMRIQRGSLRLVAPVDGVVAARNVDPGTTVVAGQAVVDVIDPASLWVNARFDQSSASGLAPALPARIQLRSRARPDSGRVARTEPLADIVTEEMLAKVTFDGVLAPLPAVGELAEVTVALPALPAAPVIPNAAIQRVGGTLGVWRVVAGRPRFTPVRLGASDLDGRVQVRAGLESGDRIVVYSERPLTARSRIRVVPQVLRTAS